MRIALYSCCLLALAGCSREPAPQTQAAASHPLMADPALLDRGARLYQEHCAQCHGPEGQGHPDWQTPNDGSFSAAPPLDAAGRAPRRTKQELLATIKAGVRKDGVDLMPGYGRRLSEPEIAAILTWLQSLWPAETYEGWLKANTAVSPQPGQ